jgi:hypothetical protein
VSEPLSFDVAILIQQPLVAALAIADERHVTLAAALIAEALRVLQAEAGLRFG